MAGGAPVHRGDRRWTGRVAGALRPVRTDEGHVDRHRRIYQPVRGRLPIPGYPIYFFGVQYGFAAEGLLLFAIPPLCLMAWLIGFVIDIAMRSTAKSRHSPPI